MRWWLRHLAMQGCELDHLFSRTKGVARNVDTLLCEGSGFIEILTTSLCLKAVIEYFIKRILIFIVVFCIFI